MAPAGVAVAPGSPSRGTSTRRPGSVRRTTNIDTVRPLEAGGVRTIDARARDLVTTAAGTAVVADTVTLRAHVEPSTYGLATLTATPDDPRLAALIGAAVAQGFRRRLLDVLPTTTDQTSLLYLLLDDLVGAQLVAGYDVIRQRAPVNRTPDPAMLLAISARADECAGWVADGTLLSAFRITGQVPMPMGPPAPVLEPDDDRAAWHVMGPLAPGAMRRRRRLDLFSADDHTEADRHDFEAHFRDSHVSDEGVETILHEYRLTGVFEAETGVLHTVTAQALVLPYGECPGALASARDVVGWTIDELRSRVNRQLVGARSCTHLNDMLRSLCDLGALARQLP